MSNRFKTERKRTLDKYKIGKYLLYAIGEILLVVIGILIALKINNWNENQKNTRIANEYFIDVATELRKDTSVFNNVMQTMDAMVEWRMEGLRMEDLNEIEYEYITAMLGGKYFNIRSNDATFNRMKNSDVFGLKEYKDLFEKISVYYTFYQDYLDNFNEWDMQVALKEAEYWEVQNDFEIGLLETDSIPIFQAKKDRQRKIIQRLSSIEGRNITKLNVFRIKTMYDIYKRHKEKATELLEMIEKEL